MTTVATQQHPRSGPQAQPKTACAARTVIEPCRWRAVMTWFGVPFCALHAPPKPMGRAGWNRL